MKHSFDKADRELGKHLPGGSAHHRAYIGSPELYDLLTASHFRLLTNLGLREHHFLLDIGAGSLRMGRLLLVYLLKGRYYAVEPNKWLIDEAIAKETGLDLIRLKQPTFVHWDDFAFSRFGRKFDFLFAHSVFTHASRKQIERCLKEASQCMHRNSLFLATYKKADVDYQGEDWVYPGTSHYRADTVSELGRPYGLRCLELPVPTGTGQTWLLFVRAEGEQDVRDLVARVTHPDEMILVAATWQERYENLRRLVSARSARGVKPHIASVAKRAAAVLRRFWERSLAAEPRPSDELLHRSDR